MSDTPRRRHEGAYDEAAYWERVDRNLGWLGNSEEEQRHRQELLRDSVIGVVGTGGIGGAVALRLARMGVRTLKLADPDSYAGLAPFFWMAKNGEREGGASVLLAKPLVDAGPLLAQKAISLAGTETAGGKHSLEPELPLLRA